MKLISMSIPDRTVFHQLSH